MISIHSKQESFSIEPDIFEGPMEDVIARIRDIKEILVKTAGCVSDSRIYSDDTGDNWTTIISWTISYDRAETEKETQKRLYKQEKAKISAINRKEKAEKFKLEVEAAEYAQFLKLKEKFENGRA